MKALIAKTAGLLLVAAPLVLVGSGAQASAKLVSANPAAGAAVGAPHMIQLQFNEPLNAKDSAANLIDESGSPIPVATTTNGTSIDATPKEGLTPGRYTVLYRAVGSAGDRARDEYSFMVR